MDYYEIAISMMGKDVPILPEDYQGEDGLICCGHCHTPKQARIEKGHFPDEYVGRIYKCFCSCMQEKQRQEKAAEEERERRERVRDLKKRCFDSVTMEALSFENDNGTVPVMGAARKYVEHFFEFEKEGRGLLLCGNPGTGKSYAAAAVCNALCEKGISCRYISTGQILGDLRGFREDQGEYLDRLNYARLLVIDDLGSERGTEYAAEIVFDVIDLRSRCRKPLIVTSNLSLKQFKYPATEAQGRIFSRILGGCHPIEVVGQDQRLVASVQKYSETRKVLGM